MKQELKYKKLEARSKIISIAMLTFLGTGAGTYKVIIDYVNKGRLYLAILSVITGLLTIVFFVTFAFQVIKYLKELKK